MRSVHRYVKGPAEMTESKLRRALREIVAKWYAGHGEGVRNPNCPRCQDADEITRLLANNPEKADEAIPLSLAYHEYMGLQLRREAGERAGNSDGEDAMLDRMDVLWKEMSVRERELTHRTHRVKPKGETKGEAPVAWMLKTGHGTKLRETISDEFRALEWNGKPMWQPLYPHPAPLPDGLTFDVFRAANVTRCVKWHPKGIESWSPSDWMTALTGELGELASLLKMRNRERDGLPGNKFSPTDKQVADELADVQTYLDLLAAALGVDLGRATVSKFNEVSERVGFPDRINLAAAPQLKKE